MAKFTLHAQDDASRIVEFDQDKITIGRSPTNDLVIDCATASRFQAEIVFLPEGFTLTNIGRAPVLVDDQIIDSCVLRNQNVLTFGRENYRFETHEVDAKTEDNDLTAVSQVGNENSDLTFVSQLGNVVDPKLVEAIPPTLVAYGADNQESSFILDKPSFVIGRSEGCDIVIDDHRVSRQHIVIERRDDGYYLVRHTAHQIVLLNSNPVDESRLYNNDKIEIFAQSFAFKSFLPRDQRKPGKLSIPEIPSNTARVAPRGAEVSGEPVTADHTTIQSDIQVVQLGPRLVSYSKRGESFNYPLRAGRNMIGRDQSCEVVIVDDTSVSRAHAIVEKQNQGHVAVAAPGCLLLINGNEAKRATRIYSGDTLQMADTLLAFLSELKEDVRPVKPWMSKVLLPLSLALALGVIGSVVYRMVWQPWQINNRIEFAQNQMLVTQDESSLVLLKQLYKENLDADQRWRVAALMAESVISRVELQIERGFLVPAKFDLEAFLRQYGAEKEIDVVWKKLNEVRLLLGQEYEADNQPKLALKEYLAINNDSENYGQAQLAISKLWLQSQQSEASSARYASASVASLLQQADDLYSKKQYLSPINSNAYAIYASILADDPANRIALGRIEEMKTFYRVQGEKYCRSGNKAGAETYFRRFLIIAPQSAEIQEALGRVDSCVSSSAQLAARKTASVASQSSKNKQKALKLLQEEGVESEWIVDFLFEDPENDSSKEDSETPW